MFYAADLARGRLDMSGRERGPPAAPSSFRLNLSVWEMLLITTQTVFYHTSSSHIDAKFKD
jgi:hypothetical protein